MSNTLKRVCGNCACMEVVQPPPDAPKDTPPGYICTRDPPVPMQQLRQGAVLRSERGEANTTQTFVLVYRMTAPALHCWSWVPKGTPPGETIDTDRARARSLMAQLESEVGAAVEQPQGAQ